MTPQRNRAVFRLLFVLGISLFFLAAIWQFSDSQWLGLAAMDWIVLILAISAYAISRIFYKGILFAAKDNSNVSGVFFAFVLIVSIPIVVIGTSYHSKVIIALGVMMVPILFAIRNCICEPTNEATVV